MKTFLIALFFAVVGYIAIALVSYFLILALSSNTHDRKMEASMTSIFVLGPIGAVLTFLISYLIIRK